ncbi:MAG: enoyl-CoA hydratase/isomerase family protein [Erythrobacter sp.]
MEYRHLKLEKDGHILTCRMSNPPDQTLTLRMIGELHHLMNEIAHDKSIRVFLCTGEDNTFLRWVQLTELQDEAVKGAGNKGAMEEPDTPEGEQLMLLSQYHNYLGALHQLAMRIQGMPFVTVAAINGNVGGGGCEFSLAFDFRLMKDIPEATFALPQSSFGIVPGGGGVYYALQNMGRARALDLLLHGDFIPAAEALELGMVSRVFSAETYDADVQAFVENFAKRAPLSMRIIKEMVNEATRPGMLESHVREQDGLRKTIYSEDFQHAISMWINNPSFDDYKPVFKGK